MFRLLLVLLSLVPSVLHAAEKPNILLICVDDLKPVLGCYGDPFAKTPHLDGLAARGLRLDRAFCNQAVCSPSRNALMTGLRPQTLGIYDLETNFRNARPDAVTVAQHFKQHGYRTEALGKIFHVGHGNTEDEASWSVPHFRPKGPNYHDPANQPPNTPEARAQQLRGAATEAADVPDEAYPDGEIAREAVRRIEAAKGKDEPFFLAVGFIKPHLPFTAPKRYWDLHDPSKLPMPTRTTPPDGAPSFAPQFGGELRRYAGIPAGNKPLGADLTRHLIHGYYAATSYMDACAGRVLDALKANGLAENTIIILWGDHGWHLGDHGMWCKHTNYEQAARIPLIVALPGKSGAVSSALVETVDLYPTLAALAGLPSPAGLDGKSFAALLDHPEQPHRDHVVHVYPRAGLLGRAIRTERHRLVEWKKPGAAPETAVFELYDYLDDPEETKNLAAELPAVVMELKKLLATHPEATPQIRAKAKPAAAPAARSNDRAAMFRKRDKDQNGKLTREEFLSNQPDPEEAPKRFPIFDADGDGVLSEAEFVQGGKANR